MARGPEPTDAEVEAALDALAEPDRFRAAEQRVARHVPELQRILNHALREGGWFDEAHEAQLRRVATAEGEHERLAGLRTLLAEETRLGMLVGVAVGWELGRELERERPRDEPPRADSQPEEPRPDERLTEEPPLREPRSGEPPA